MHEMALMASMMEIIEGQAKAEGFARVEKVVLEIGRLSGAEAEAMRFAFDVATQDSLAQGAVLEIEETPGRGRCPDCDLESPMEVIYDPCPGCGRVPLSIIAGRDMRILALEVE